jgi:hypothetical protein
MHRYFNTPHGMYSVNDPSWMYEDTHGHLPKIEVMVVAVQRVSVYDSLF